MKSLKYLIVSGGTVEEWFLADTVKNGGFDVILAVDRGMNALYRMGILPDLIVGDFDSADPKILEYYQEQDPIEICQLNPQKDDTDTEFAIREAIRRGAEDITILGGCGSRLDHVLGNIWLLGIGLKESVSVQLLDPHNRIRMIDKPLTISRRRQYGHYVSLIPFSGSVQDVTLSGMAYPLEHATLSGFGSLGISNEIVEEEANIAFTEGILLVIESKD